MKKLAELLVAVLLGAAVGMAALWWSQDQQSESHRENDGLSFSTAVTHAAPSVVNIYTTKIVRARRNPLCDLPRFQSLCAESGQAAQRARNSLGSGVVVDEQGHILTNNHVISGADEIIVAFNNGEQSAARVIGTDAETDLAVLQIEQMMTRPIDMSQSQTPNVGDVVLAIGNPFGIGQTVSMGIVSGTGRYGISDSVYEDFIQTDAAINPGNSGGALVDSEGRLVGINTLIFSQSGGSQGIGFAIPSKLAMAVLEQLIEQGRVVRGWLGIVVRDTSEGLVVAQVLRDGPAWQAGLRAGDLLTAVDGKAATSSREITLQIADYEPGSPVKLSVQRGANVAEVIAITAARPAR